MAESELSISYDDLLSAVGSFLGYPIDPDLQSDTQRAEVDLYIQSGIRQFYFPPAVEGVESAFEWSFLTPTATILTVIDQAENDLPDDCSRVLGDFYFAPDTYSRSIPVVSEARIMAMRQQSTDSGLPIYAAVRYKSEARAETTGQRLEVAWWQTPSAAYTLTYKYQAYSGKLTDDLPYPLGGMKHGELITESCLAIAEQRANDEKGLHWDSFMRLLKSGIEQDRKTGAMYFGHMGGPGDESVYKRRDNGEVTYKGETW